MVNFVIQATRTVKFEDGLRTGVLSGGYRCHCNDAWAVKPGFKPVPPELYFEFAAFFWPS